MARDLRIGLIGQKFMGRAHSNAWSQVGRFFDLPREVRLACIAARDAAELEPFAQRFGYARWTADWRELVAAEDVDLVDVSTPNHVHAEQAVAALKAGKHVACEKPLAGTLEDARAMRDAARRAKKKGRSTFVWFNYRRCPAIGTAYELVREGRLGEIHHVRATYLQSWGGPETPSSWRFRRSLAGSGAHGDLNAHLVDLARFLTGDEVAEVSGALAHTFHKERVEPGTKKRVKSDVDDAVLFLARFGRGAVASFEASRVAAPHQNANSIELNGSKGSLRFDFEDMNLLRFHDERDGKRLGGWRRIMCTSAGEHPYAENWWPDAHLVGYEHGFTNMAADVVRAVSGRKPRLPLPDFDDAYETQRVLAAALLAASERRAVRMREVR